MRWRSVFFWLHLGAGLLAGSIVLVMSGTGVLLAFERQITEWADRGYRAAPAAGASRLSAEALLGAALAAQSEARSGAVASLTVQSDPAAPAAVSLGRGRNLYLNPYTGAVLGEGAPGVRTFFRKVTDLHRWLGAGEKSRDTGKAITGAGNLLFLLLVLSGLYLWLPRTWTRRQVRNVAWFRRGLSGKARDFNWHNAIGLWAWAPLVLIVASGVLISYPWATNLLFRLTGDKPVEARSPERRSEGGGIDLAGLDALWAVALARVPDWQSVTLRLPAGDAKEVTFQIASGHRGRPDLRSHLILDRRSGAVEEWETFASQGLGRRLRAWGRWVHTGEAGGVFGQAIAGLASAGAVVLVWTGFALAWRRFFRRQPATQTSKYSRFNFQGAQGDSHAQEARSQEIG
jgi:uncharacterized iron-regulated membrane protein